MDRAKLDALMEAEGLDALLASSAENIYYTSRFPVPLTAENRGLFLLLRTSEAVAVLLPKGRGEILLCTVGLAGMAEEHCPGIQSRFSGTGMFIEWPEGMDRKVTGPAPRDNLVAALKEFGLGKGRLGIEFSTLSAGTFEHLRKTLPGLSFADARPTFLKLREIKTPEEIDRMRQANRVNTAGIRAALGVIREGARERDVLRAFKEKLREMGCDWESAALGAGPGSGEAYHIAGDYILKPGDAVRFDVTAVHRFCFSDLSRCATVGDPPGEVRRLYDALFEAQQAAVAAVRPAVPANELFRVGVEKVRAAGYPQYERGNMGHGVGIGHYEEPFVTPDNETPLEAGMTLAVEAPYYVAGRYGLNVENNVLVTDRGCEILDEDLSLDLFRCG
ncbi:MAG: M24 family metallopeptidase [Nitrospinota bacterium]